jgi:hypothetical protein
VSEYQQADSLAEEKAWQDASNLNSKESYTGYLEQYPEGWYIDSAKLYMKQLEPENIDSSSVELQVDSTSTF